MAFVPCPAMRFAFGRLLLARLLIAVAVLVSAAGAARCQDPAALGGARQNLSLDGRTAVLLDDSRTLQLADVIAPDAPFTPLAGHNLNLGYGRMAAWMRLTIAATATETALLSLSPNFVDVMDVYVARQRDGLAPSDFAKYHMGDHRPLPVDAVSGLDNIVPLDLVAGETTLVFIRVLSVNSSLNIAARLDPLTDHTQRITRTTLAFGAWFGGMLILMAIQIVFYLFDRKPVYVLLALSAISAIMVYMGNLGLSRILLFPGGGPANDYFMAGAVWFGLGVFTLAASAVLELPRTTPWLHKMFLAGAGIGVIGIVCTLLGANPIFAPFGNLTIIVLSTLAMLHSLRSANGDGMTAPLTAAGFFILWLGLFATLTQRSGIYPLPNWVAHGYGLSCLIHMLLLTGALAVRLRAAEAMNRTMRERALTLAQEAEQRANAKIEEKTRELADAKTIAEEALRAELESQAQQVRFMEVLSHQIRTPLTIIRTNMDMIALGLDAADGANRSRFDRIRRAMTWLVEMLEVNLIRSRLQGPSFQPDLALVSLRELTSAAAMRGRDLTQGSDILLDIAPDAIATKLMADAEMLSIAVLNLLDNAVKYSALTGAPPVQLSCSTADGHGIIAVSDQGIGIPADEITNILARSVRGSNAQHVEGSGMGLSLVSRIAAAHGGKIDIDSVIGRGTTVRLVLPAAQA